MSLSTPIQIIYLCIFCHATGGHLAIYGRLLPEYHHTRVVVALMEQGTMYTVHFQGARHVAPAHVSPRGGVE